MKRLLSVLCFAAAVVATAEELIVDRPFAAEKEIFTPWRKAGAAYAPPAEAKLPGGKAGAVKFRTRDFADALIRIKLPLDQVRGRTVKLEADMRAENLEKPSADWLGPKIMLHAVTPRLQINEEQPKIWGTHGWRHFTVYAKIPADATQANVVLGLQKGKGTIYLANVKAVLPDEDVVFFRPFSTAGEVLAPWRKSGAEYASPEEAKLPGGTDGAIKFHAADFATKLIQIKVPVDRVRGGTVLLEADMRAVNLEKTNPEWLGPKIMFHAVASGKQIHAEQPKVWGTYDWRHFRISARIPREATMAEVILGLQKGKGTIYLANVKVVAVPESSDAKAAAKP